MSNRLLFKYYALGILKAAHAYFLLIEYRTPQSVFSFNFQKQGPSDLLNQTVRTSKGDCIV